MPSTTRPRAARLVSATCLVLAASVLPVTGVAATTTPVGSSPLAPRPTTRVATVAQQRIVSLLPQRVARTAALGRYRTGLVTDPVTGAALWSSGATTPMRGASTTKLATAITTLQVLGTSTRFPTRVVAGRTAREVVLVAGGDPMLTSTQLKALARSTAAALLPAVPAAPQTPPAPTTPPKVVRFTVTVDDTLFPAPTSASGWTSSYQPYVVTPVRPLVRDLRNGWDTAADVTTYFTGQVNAALASSLKARTDITPHVVYTGRLKATPGAAELARFAGNTSGAALRWMLLVSDNDVAEMLFRLNAIASGAGGSWSAASSSELSTLRSLGIDVTGWRIYDGSGVSRNDRVTARGLVQLLTVAASPKRPKLNVLRGWLPVAGNSGTLDARFTARPTSCARGKVYAKTGTLFDTIGLAGYAKGSDGHWRTFAVLVRSVDPRYSKLQVRRAVEVIPATATGCY
jgi:serine-type D-Ala-D-Ala carboxypeptidase/endopeptidase (penicillin-binding protein 4)